MATIINVENLSKSFIISHEGKEKYVALRDIMAQKAKKIFSFSSLFSQKEKVTKEEFWALKDVNFKVQQGDRLGIIGRNGAGKSTLLKILSRITEPTSGILKVKGRVASLLEVGTGFHPELTGRENIYLNGAILGMSRAEIKKHFEAIVDFAEIEQFLDTPVKRYSSGMYVRLAFAVAAHLEPEILVVDEVLAVGDAQFQKKCLGKMEDVSKNEGRTVLFVSHNMSALNSLTNTAICLIKGKIGTIGTTQEAIRYYLENTNIEKGVYKKEPAKLKPSITFAEVITSENDGIHNSGKDLKINVDVYMPVKIEGMSLSIQIFNDSEIAVVYLYTFNESESVFSTIGVHRASCILPACRLYENKYHLKLHLAETKGKEKFEEVDKVCSFEVKMMDSIIEWGWQKDVCIYNEDFRWVFSK